MEDPLHFGSKNTPQSVKFWFFDHPLGKLNIIMYILFSTFTIGLKYRSDNAISDLRYIRSMVYN